MEHKRTWKEYFRRERTTDRVYLIVSWIFKISFITLSLRGIFEFNDPLIFIRTLLAFLLLLIPPIVDVYFDIRVPPILDLIITLALFFHQRGVIFGIYDLIPKYDMVLHTFSSIVLASLIMTSIYLVEKNWSGLKMSMGFMAFFTIIATMAMGVVWEIAEFALDQIFGYNTQPGLVDTMQDLILDTVGASIVAIGFYLKVHKKGMSESMEDLDKSIKRKFSSSEATGETA